MIAAIQNNLVMRFGCPRYLLTDNGSNFMSGKFKTFMKIFNIAHKRSLPYHPQTNGMIERMNQTLKRKLAIAAEEQHLNLFEGDIWTSLIPAIVFSYNSTKNVMTGHSPHELIYGCNPTFPMDLALNI